MDYLIYLYEYLDFFIKKIEKSDISHKDEIINEIKEYKNIPKEIAMEKMRIFEVNLCRRMNSIDYANYRRCKELDLPIY